MITMAKVLMQEWMLFLLELVGMVFRGHSDTLSVVDDMIYHSKCVRGLSTAHLVVDMPFMSYQTSVVDAVRNAGRLLKEICTIGQTEGGQSVALSKAIVDAGIQVVAFGIDTTVTPWAI